MTALNYCSILSSVCSIAIAGHVIARPSLLAWRQRTVRILGAATMLLALLTLFLILTNKH